MRKLLIALCMVCLVSLCSSVNIFANTQDIRVGLFFDIKNGCVDSQYTQFTISSNEGLQIKKCDDLSDLNCDEISIHKIDNQRKIVAYKDNEFIVARDDEYLEIVPKDGLFKINNDDSKIYRGSLIVNNISDSQFALINKLNLEEYLYGVVEKEIGSYAPKEAIKAQAVAARTYAISHIGMFSKYGFDVTDSKYQQVYKGYSTEKDNVNKAVDETCGLVMYYNDIPIRAFYFASSGGKTENSENVWNSPIPYLVSVLDEYEINRRETSRWIVEFTKEQIEGMLANRNIVIGDLLDIQITKRSESGRVLELQYIGTTDTYTRTKNDVRLPLNLKSQWFWIEKENDVYKFCGKGNGHGVGLSQVGAMGMADAGFGFLDILTHYFTGIEIKNVQQ